MVSHNVNLVHFVKHALVVLETELDAVDTAGKQGKRFELFLKFCKQLVARFIVVFIVIKKDVVLTIYLFSCISSCGQAKGWRHTEMSRFQQVKGQIQSCKRKRWPQV